MKSFREFRVWEMAHAVTLAVYRETEHFPAHERFGLTSQMRRAASSIPMNIAGGSVRSAGQFEFSLRVALGSAAELDYQLMLAHDLGYLNGQRLQEWITPMTSALPCMDDASVSASPTAYNLRPTVIP
jgi:four helix bundle protein